MLQNSSIMKEIQLFRRQYCHYSDQFSSMLIDFGSVIVSMLQNSSDLKRIQFQL